MNKSNSNITPEKTGVKNESNKSNVVNPNEITNINAFKRRRLPVTDNLTDYIV